MGDMAAVERHRNDARFCRDCRRSPFQQLKGRIAGLEHAMADWYGRRVVLSKLRSAKGLPQTR